MNNETYTTATIAINLLNGEPVYTKMSDSDFTIYLNSIRYNPLVSSLMPADVEEPGELTDALADWLEANIADATPEQLAELEKLAGAPLM